MNLLDTSGCINCQGMDSGKILGALLVAQFVAVLVDLQYGNHLFAFLLATELQVFGIFLLYDMEYTHDQDTKDTKSNEWRDAPPVGTILVEDGEGPTISNITTFSEDMSHSSEVYYNKGGDDYVRSDKDAKSADKVDESDHSNYASMASMSTTENSSENNSENYDNYDQSRSLEFCYGFSMSYAGIFILVHTLSALLLLSSLNQQIYEMNLFTGVVLEEWSRRIFLLAYGVFLASSILSYYKRYLEAAFDYTIVRNSRGKQILSLLMAVLSLGIFGHAFQVRNGATQQLDPFFYGVSDEGKVSPQPYRGEAWVAESYCVDANAVCESFYDAIPVNVTVAYGGEWGCPENSDQQCEATVTTQVECRFYESLLYPSTEEDDEVSEEEYDAYSNPSDVTVEDYIDFRYNDYQVDDDNQIDYNEMPSYSYWNRPTDTIIGTCDGSCTVRSEFWISNQYRSYAQSNHTMYLSLGIGVCFLLWPLCIWWTECRRRIG